MLKDILHKNVKGENFQDENSIIMLQMLFDVIVLKLSETVGNRW